jgi:hypothetical protein
VSTISMDLRRGGVVCQPMLLEGSGPEIVLIAPASFSTFEQTESCRDMSEDPKHRSRIEMLVSFRVCITHSTAA